MLCCCAIYSKALVKKIYSRFVPRRVLALIAILVRVSLREEFKIGDEHDPAVSSELARRMRTEKLYSDTKPIRRLYSRARSSQVVLKVALSLKSQFILKHRIPHSFDKCLSFFLFPQRSQWLALKYLHESGNSL